MLWTILFYLVVGTIVGLLGKFFAPGDKDNIPLWLTVVCGIGGMLIGGLIYHAFGGNGSSSTNGGLLTSGQGDRCPGSMERGGVWYPESGYPCNPREVPTGR